LEIKNKALFLLKQKTNLEFIYPKIDKKMCSGCSSCLRICLKKALYMQEKFGKKYPVLNKKKCDGCCHCISICPNKAMSY